MDENNLTPTVDTTLWQMPTTAPTHVNADVSSMPYQEVKPLSNIKDISPDINALVGNIRFDSTNSMANLTSGRSSLMNKLFPDANKIDLTSEVPLTETHEQLSDGSWIPKYKSYMEGVDNDARLSAQQSDSEKFFNPIKRFMSNTSKAPLDLLSGVYGIGAAALTGRFDAIYDNGFAHYVDDWTAKTNFEYKNYYNEHERNQSLGMNLQTWDKVLGGAEFTARMLASEAILAIATDGLSLPGALAKTGLKAASLADKAGDVTRITETGRRIARMMNIAQAPELSAASRGVNSGSRMLNALETAANRGKMGDALVKARFAVTSPMYEAGFEARHFQNEAEKQFWDYHRERGTHPTPEEVNAFATKLSGAANGVFVTNMAILAPSNLAMVGDMLNIKGRTARWIGSSGDDIAKNVFRIGTEVGEDGTYAAMKAGFFNKAAAYVSPFVKGALVEGVYEEGSQGIASGTYSNYVASSYDPEAMKSTAKYIDAFGKAFSDQFSTKEGMEEIAIGALIGGLMGGVGGARNTAREYKKQERIAEIQNMGTEFAEDLKSNIYTNEQLLSLFSSANRFQDLRQQMEVSGDNASDLKQASLQAQSFISMLDAYHSVGKGSEFTKMIKNVFTGLDNQYVADATGLSLSEANTFKQEQIRDMEEIANKYSTAIDAGRYIFGGKIGGFTEVEVDGKVKKVNGQTMANALAFSSTMALFNEKFATQNFDAFTNKLAGLTTSRELIEKIGAIAAIKKASALELQSYYELNSQESKLKGDINKITDKINTLNASEEKTNNALERLRLSNELMAIQEQLRSTTSKKDTLWKSMVDNLYARSDRKGVLPQIDMETFTQQAKDIQTSLDNSNFSKEDKLMLNQLLNQFSSANEAYKSFTGMANNIADSKFTFRTYNQMFKGLRGRLDQSINDHTRDTLVQLYGQGVSASQIRLDAEKRLNTTSPITDEVVNSTETPSETNIAYIKERLNKRRTLNPNEQKFYDSNKDAVDAYEVIDTTDPLNSTSQNTVINDLTVKLNARMVELENLENGIFSDKLQSELDAIQAQEAQNTAPNMGALTFEVTGEQGDIYTVNVDENDVAMVTHPDGRVIELDQMNDTVRNAVSKKIAELRNISNSENMITNLDEVITDGSGKLNIEENGTEVKFDMFDIVIDATDNTAEVANIKKSDRSANKGIGFKAYIELGNRLLEKGIVLTSAPGNKLTGGLNLWKRLVAEGYATGNNKIGYTFTGLSTENDAVIEKIEEEKLRLEDEIAVLNGEMTDAERAQRLEEEIRQLRNELLNDSIGEMTEGDVQGVVNDSLVSFDQNNGVSEEDIRDTLGEPYTFNKSKIKRLVTLQRELIQIKNKKTEFDPNGTPIEQLEWVLNNVSGLNFESTDELADIKKPTQDLVDEYMDLLNTKKRNTVQKKRLAELREQLLPFNLAEGLTLDGVNVLEIIDLYNQNKRKKEVTESEQNELPEEEMQTTIGEAERNTKSQFASPSVGLVYDGAYIERKKNGYKIYHVRLNTMMQRAFDSGFAPQVTVYGEDADGNRVVVETITVDAQNLEQIANQYDGQNNVKIDLSPELYVIKYKEDTSFIIKGELDEMMNLLGASPYAITGQPTSYISLYSPNLDGSMQPRESEFTITNDGVEIPFDKEANNSIKAGDRVTLEFDLNDDYNKTLDPSEYETQGRIYIKKDGKLVNILKGTGSRRSTGEQWDKLEALRKKVINSTKNVTVEVENSYLGFPIITLNQDGTAREIPLDESKVLAYGYTENGEIKGQASGMNIDDDQYIRPLSTNGKKSPIVLFEAYGKVIAFPINVKPEGVDLSADVDAIIDNTSLSRERKIFEINALLEANGMFTTDLAVDNNNFDTAKVKQALESIYEAIDVTDQLELAKATKTAFIDLNDPFKSAKLVLNFKKVKQEQIVQVTKVSQQTVKKTVKTPGRKGRNNSNNNTC